MEKITVNGKEYDSITKAIRVLLNEGKSRTDIAKTLNVHYSYVSNVVYYDSKKNSPEAIATKEEKKRIKAAKKALKIKKNTEEALTEEEIIAVAINTESVPDTIAKDMKKEKSI